MIDFPDKGVPNNDVMRIPLNTCSGAILSSITSIFIILGSKAPYLCREVSQESHDQIWREPTPPKPKNGPFLHPQLSN